MPAALSLAGCKALARASRRPRVTKALPARTLPGACAWGSILLHRTRTTKSPARSRSHRTRARCLESRARRLKVSSSSYRSKPRIRNGRPIHKLKPVSGTVHRQLSTNRRSAGQRLSRHCIEPAAEPAESSKAAPNRASKEPSILISAKRAAVLGIKAAISPVSTPTPPGVKAFKGSQSYPAQSPAPKAKKPDKRRTPRMPEPARPWPPAPALPAIHEPSSVVKGRPTPGLGIHPRPSVVGLVYPLPIAIRRPSGIRCTRRPHCSILRADPRAVGIQIGYAGHIAACVLVAGRR